MSGDDLSSRPTDEFRLAPRLVYDQEPEYVSLNRHHLQLLLERIERAKRKPRIEDATPWFAVFLTMLLALIPADFQNFAGLQAQTWEAMAVIALIVTGAITIAFFVRALRSKDQHANTAEYLVTELFADMGRKARRPEVQETPVYVSDLRKRTRND